MASKALYLFAAASPVVLVGPRRRPDREGVFRTAPRDALIADSTPAESRGRASRAAPRDGYRGRGRGRRLGRGRDRARAGRRLDARGRDLPAPRARRARTGCPRPRRDRPSGSGTSPTAPRTSPPRHWSGPACASGPLLFPARTGCTSRPFACSSARQLVRRVFLAIRSQSLGVTVRDLMLIIIAFNVVNSLVAWPAGGLSDPASAAGASSPSPGASLRSPTPASRSPGPRCTYYCCGCCTAPTTAVNEAVRSGAGRRPRRAAPARHRVRHPQRCVGFAILPASVIAGLLWDRLGQPAPFWFGALCATAAIVLLAFVRRPAGGAESR